MVENESLKNTEEKKEEEYEASEEYKKEEEPVTPSERIIIRTYPKIAVMAFDMMILSLIFAIISSAVASENVLKALGITFLLAYFFLTLIVAFEFTEWKFLAIVMLIVILVLLYVLLSVMGYIPSGSLSTVYDMVNPTLSRDAYLGIAILSLIALIFMWFRTRFNYWIIEPNQVIRRTGLFGKYIRYPTRNVRVSVSISDILEYWLFFGSGTIVLEFPLEHKTFVLTMVPRAKEIERRINKILGYVEVE